MDADDSPSHRRSGLATQVPSPVMAAGQPCIVLGGQTVKHYEDGGEYIIHPLFDAPEAKIDTDNLGPLHLAGASRWSLIGLRVYLVFGMLALVYYVLQIATGAIH